MKTNSTKESQLKKLDKSLRAGGLAAIAIAAIVLLASAACLLLWHFRQAGQLDQVRYDSMVSALEVETFAFMPCIGLVVLGLGLHILYFQHKRSDLLKDDHDA